MLGNRNKKRNRRSVGRQHAPGHNTRSVRVRIKSPLLWGGFDARDVDVAGVFEYEWREAKTSEVPMAAGMLSQVNLNGKIVTADALHTVTANAEFICGQGPPGQGERSVVFR